MSNNYISPYYDSNRPMLMQPTHRTIPQDMYTTLATSTTAPSAPMAVLNPYDRTYRWFHDAFNEYKLHPNQTTARGYYTINTAYGESPIQTQIERSCSGYLSPENPVGRNNVQLVSAMDRELVLKQLEKRNVNPAVINEVRQDFYRLDMKSQNISLVTAMERELVLKHLEKRNVSPAVINQVRRDFEKRDMEAQNLAVTTAMDRELVLQDLRKRNVSPAVLNEVRQDFRRRDMESQRKLLTTVMERELVLKHLENRNVSPAVINEVRRDFERRDMERR